MEDNTLTFMKELWYFLISAQNTEGGIPKEFLEKEREEQLKAVVIIAILSSKLLQSHRMNKIR